MFQSVYSPTAVPTMYGAAPPMQRITVDRVNGRQGAEMYGMAPDSSALILDTNNPIIWFIQTDSAGFKSITQLDFVIHKDEPAQDIKNFDSRMNEFDERLRTIEEALR